MNDGRDELCKDRSASCDLLRHNHEVHLSIIPKRRIFRASWKIVGGLWLPITPERISRLREFGLSEYATRAYLALLDLGLTEARDVSNISRVPQAKVYQVLDQLHDKGLVIILPEFPKKYAPVPFEEFLDRIERQHVDAADSIRRTRDELTSLFAVAGNVDVGDRGDLMLLRGRRNVLDKMGELVKTARREVLIMATAGMCKRPAFLRDIAQAARANGVNTRIMLPVDNTSLDRLGALDEIASLRARAPSDGSASDNVAIVLVDERHVLLIHFVPDDGDPSNGRDVAVSTDQEALVGAVRVLLAPLWKSAPTLADMRRGAGPEDQTARVYQTRAQADGALVEALRRGVKRLAIANGVARAHEFAAEEHLVPGAHVRLLVSADTGTDIAIPRALASAASLEVRSDAGFGLAACWIIDDREAFLAVDLGEGQADLVLHTRGVAAVRGLQEMFENAWAHAHTTESESFIQRLAAAFDHMKDCVLATTDDGRLVMWNRACERAFGVARAEALAATVEDVFPGGHARLRNASDGDRIQMDARTSDGRRVVVEAAIHAFSSDKVGVRVVILREVEPRGRTIPVQGSSAVATDLPARGH